MAGHGGAWKVAYADFVTAMMALFMVLWISAQDKEILISTSQYFQNPFRSPMDASSGVMPFNSNKSSSNNADGGLDRNKQVQMTFLNSVAADFYRLLNLDESMASKPIDIQVTSDGLRVTLFDRAKQPLFARDSTDLTEWGTFVLQAMAWTIERHKFNVTIDGHAGVRPVSKPSYDNWDLSADRANASRRVLVHYAVDPRQIERVTGYADTRPIPGETGAESNERITLNLTLTAKSRAKDGPAKESPTKERPPTKEGPGREALPGEKAAVVTPAH
ncbi:flagellar motor protein MotB [Horticoccus sp. 23ND18S-11]|uniref:flagellar motor protein MotB n=1 Tax=Horticoccus sp. 23ND18S-11 TaxID=3391832 RepID=UPI0039C940A7